MDDEMESLMIYVVGAWFQTVDDDVVKLFVADYDCTKGAYKMNTVGKARRMNYETARAVARYFNMSIFVYSLEEKV